MSCWIFRKCGNKMLHTFSIGCKGILGLKMSHNRSVMTLQWGVATSRCRIYMWWCAVTLKPLKGRGEGKGVTVQKEKEEPAGGYGSWMGRWITGPVCFRKHHMLSKLPRSCSVQELLLLFNAGRQSKALTGIWLPWGAGILRLANSRLCFTWLHAGLKTGNVKNCLLHDFSVWH